MTAPGWYKGEGDPPGTQRYWDGMQWIGNAVPAPSAVPSTPSGYRLAEPMARIGARLIDAIIVFVILGIIVSANLGGTRNSAVLENSDFSFNINGSALDNTFEFLVFGLIAFVWSVAWIHLKGGTPGKLLLGLRISDAGTGAVPVVLKQAVLRSANLLLPLLGALSIGLGNAASTVVGLVGFVSLIMLFADDQNRTVMDHLAKTLVVTTK